MTHVTCRLTDKNRDQLRNPTLGNRVWAIFTVFIFTYSFTYYVTLTGHLPQAQKLAIADISPRLGLVISFKGLGLWSWLRSVVGVWSLLVLGVVIYGYFSLYATK